MKYYLFIIGCILTISALGQTQEQKIEQANRENQQAIQAEIDRQLDRGVMAMEAGDYQEANNLFRMLLSKVKVVPTDLVFFFGKNSFYLDKFQQSADWLNKYIELKGTSGQHYGESVELLEKANVAFLALKDREREEAGQVLSRSFDIDCGPSGKVICPVCSGNGVIIQQTAFGKSYKTCPYSDDHGYLTCEEYNQLIRGELQPKF